uniref:Uncharacterized protein n=1 Tax=Oryza punctata TaxID=4537 RepID=A0A0E0LKI7_ORYPU
MPISPTPATTTTTPSNSKLIVDLFVLPSNSKQADCNGSWRRQSALAVHHLPMGTIAAKILPWEAPSRETQLMFVAQSNASSRRWLQRAFDMALSVYQGSGNLLTTAR